MVLIPMMPEWKQERLVRSAADATEEQKSKRRVILEKVLEEDETVEVTI